MTEAGLLKEVFCLETDHVNLKQVPCWCRIDWNWRILALKAPPFVNNHGPMEIRLLCHAMSGFLPKVP